MTPYEVRLLLKIYTSNAPLNQAPILADTLRKFVDQELVSPIRGPHEQGFGWMVTYKGACYCEALCALPVPTPEKLAAKLFT